MGGGAAPAAAPVDEPIAQASQTAPTTRVVKSFEDLIALAAEKRDLTTKSALERDVRLVAFEDGKLELALEASARKSLVGELSKKLSDWTGRPHGIIVNIAEGKGRS